MDRIEVSNPIAFGKDEEEKREDISDFDDDLVEEIPDDLEVGTNI